MPTVHYIQCDGIKCERRILMENADINDGAPKNWWIVLDPHVGYKMRARTYFCSLLCLKEAI